MASNKDLKSVERRQTISSLDKWPVFCQMSEEFVHNIHSFIIYGETGNEVIVVTKDDVVFHMNVNNITQMTQLSELKAKGVIKVVGGESHVCALTSVGEVYVWGDNMDSQLGTGNTTSSPIPLKMSFNLNNEKIVDIECGLRHTLALTDAGHVYAWGYNGHGQLGNGNFRNQSTHIKVIGVLEKYHVTSIVCGGYHSLAVTDTGSVFGWGYGGQGQLGMSNTTYKSEPVQIKYFKDMRVAKVCAGIRHTILLLSDGSVYTFGYNDHGQLGTNDKTDRSSPFKVNINHHGPIVDVVSHINSYISAAVTANGVLYLWGECRQPIGDLLNPIFVLNFDSIYDVFGVYGKTQTTYRSIPMNTADDNHPVLNSMTDAFDNTISSNFRFVIDGQPIHVIKEYLIIRCKSMEPMICLLDTNQTEVVITDYSYEAFKAFLRYLYTNDVFVAPDIAVELLGLANTYAETDLKRKCTQLIRNGITVENVALIYGAAVKYKEPTLQDICFKYAVKNFENVSKTDTFNDLDIDIYKDFIRKASLKGAFSR